jgi:uncharacterized membrane protein
MDAPGPMPLSCPDCAAQMPETASFCPGCGRPMHTAPRAQGKVGALPESLAAALAYFTFIPAVFFLLRFPFNRNRFVRFHSVQCLLLWLMCASAAAALRLAALVVILLPVLGPLFVTLLYVIAAIAVLVIWVVLVVKAFQGEMFQLPVLGLLAEHYADPIESSK